LAALAAEFAVAGLWSVRLAAADYWFTKETPEGTEKALALTPDQSAYYVLLALLVGDDHPSVAVAALRKAVTLNPSDARAWVELGLRYEAAGDLGAAEQTLLRAAAEDRTYLPRWTLLNYYFRHNDTDRFWYWAKAAVPMIYGDALPLFHLCGRVDEDGKLIDRLEIRKPEIQAAYLFYLLVAGRADLAGPSSRRLLMESRSADVPLLLDACDRLIDAHSVDDAVAIWNGLIHARRLPYGDFPEGVRPTLTNGDFAASPSGRGFDWRLPSLEGISAAREETAPGLRLTFSGAQAEAAEPLVQLVPVRERTAYELKFVYRTSGIGARTGLSWSIGEMGTGRSLKDGEDLASEEQVSQRMDFATPAGCRMVRLSLAYRRRPGTTRIAGYIVLRDVEVKPATQFPSDDGPRSRVMK
jgi:hypothetical protein